MPYNTNAEADSYFSARFGFDSWGALTEPQKSMSLFSANQILDNLCDWYGTKTSDTQTNEFPRDGETVVPEKIKQAELEIAFNIISTNSTSTDSGDSLEELKAGSVALKFKVENKGANPLLNDLTKRLLSGYGICFFGGSSRIVRLIR